MSRRSINEPDYGLCPSCPWESEGFCHKDPPWEKLLTIDFSPKTGGDILLSLRYTKTYRPVGPNDWCSTHPERKP